jgi:hypothetical protein
MDLREAAHELGRADDLGTALGHKADVLRHTEDVLDRMADVLHQMAEQQDNH